MAWLQDQEADENASTQADKWLKIPEPEAVNKSTEVTIRFLDSTPEDSWRHWLENRLFNCPGFETCPVCKVRQPLLKANREEAQKRYRTDHRFFANVLHEGKVKIYSFGPGVAKDLLVFVKKYEEKYGDITSYDVTIIKRKTGRLPQNVEYTVVAEIPPRELTEEEQDAASNTYDLAFVKTPASREDLQKVAVGELPESKDIREAESEDRPKVGNAKATKADIMLLKAVLASRPGDLELSHFGINENDTIDKAVVDQLIEELKRN